MGKIFYLCGKSSSGKDTIFKKILEDGRLDLKTLVPYTTRPIRDGETHGVEYFFTDEAELEQIEEDGRLIEVRSYDTFHGVWKYFTVNDSQIDLEKYNYIIIGTLDSYRKTKDFFGEEVLVPLYIDVDDGIRLQRALDREKTQDKPRYEEMCRRFLADASDFAPEKIREAGIKKIFQNDELNKCAEEVVQYILNIIITDRDRTGK